MNSASYAGNAGEIGRAAAMGAFFFAGIQQHDDEDEKHHDSAGIDDDLCQRQETPRPAKDIERRATT